ncbi:predicted protein [Nematostella vectensis]|uniref:Ig-like domain-containing protein n=1 Tax=Nematostella vectensis TaxID=45351 RepID=A7T484_NEMVE|nr:predicted protein [Nematostella vectensis]|eukprot:XP_001621329.1 hypothetical protein NEMVEDRAFT_v1g222098 [Nematostella vectensis]
MDLLKQAFSKFSETSLFLYLFLSDVSGSISIERYVGEDARFSWWSLNSPSSYFVGFSFKDGSNTLCWWRTDVPVNCPGNTSDKFIGRLFYYGNSTNNITFEIKNVKVGDEGSYKVTIRENIAPTTIIERSGMLTVLEAPAFTSSLNSTYDIAENDDVTVTCSASGRPAPNVTWVNKTSGSPVTHGTGTATLSLLKIQRHQAGVYQCQAINDVGRGAITQDITINVQYDLSEHKLNVLDLTLHLVDGFIKTDVYAKPSDSHFYLPPTSCHPEHCKRAIPYSVALRLKRNCSDENFLCRRNNEYKNYLIEQGYKPELVSSKFNEVASLSRSELLKPKSNRAKRKVTPLVMDFNPNLPDIGQIVRKNLSFLHSSTFMKEVFPEGSIISAFRRPKNLKDILAPSKFKQRAATEISNQENNSGCFKCGKKCDLCSSYFVQSRHFISAATGKKYFIRQRVSCNSKNAIYLATCRKCNLQYVGSCTTEFKSFREYLM